MTRSSDDRGEPSGLVRLAHSLTSGMVLPPPDSDAPAGIAPKGFGWEAGILAIGWATVDLERSAAELADIAFEFAHDDEALGARALIGHPGRVGLVLLEPSTEGRLAATLARNGEGLAVVYQQSRGLVTEGALKMTPLGRAGRLVDPGRRWGPFLIVVD